MWRMLILWTSAGTVTASASELPSVAARGISVVGTERVRDIHRGLYLKSNIGANVFMGPHGHSDVLGTWVLHPGVSTALAVGRDFVDRERWSAAVEGALSQGTHNGPDAHELKVVYDATGGESVVEGAIYRVAGVATTELSVYPTRRFGMGLRAGGGVTVVPTQAVEDPYAAEGVDVPEGTWPGLVGALPTVLGGPTLEYYSKLSHFSLGADLDVLVAVGFDWSVNPTAYLKYTF